MVVDEAEKKIGKEIEVEFVRLNQTASGTMMFAKQVIARRQSAKKVITRVASKRSARKAARSDKKTKK